MPKAITGKTPRSVTETIRDAHDESGRVVSRTIIHDDDILHFNKRARLEGVVDRKRGLSPHDGAEIQYHFRISPEAWTLFKRKRPDIAAGLHSGDQFIRETAAKKLSELKPEWVVASPKRDHFH